MPFVTSSLIRWCWKRVPNPGGRQLQSINCLRFSWYGRCHGWWRWCNGAPWLATSTRTIYVFAKHNQNYIVYSINKYIYIYKSILASFGRIQTNANTFSFNSLSRLPTIFMQLHVLLPCWNSTSYMRPLRWEDLWEARAAGLRFTSTGSERKVSCRRGPVDI